LAIALIAAAPSVADVDAHARASGNRLDIAQQIGHVVFATPWSAQVTQISANQLDSHIVVGIRISGVKFHAPLTKSQYEAEVVSLVQHAFAVVPTAEEVDVWTSVPIIVGKDVVVSGDLAKPTSRPVFTMTARRSESAAQLQSRMNSGTSVFWDQDWAHTAFKQGT
jgi:hypothetical protein